MRRQRICDACGEDDASFSSLDQEKGIPCSGIVASVTGQRENQGSVGYRQGI